MFPRLFRKDQEHEAALELYGDIIVQSRHPIFYADLAVPDTPEGRFDMITLHTFMVLRRLKDEPEITARFAQKLFDVMFQNMDHSLREMGVGDLSVGKKVRGLAEAFYGRVGAYNKALEFPEKAKFLDALARNIYDDEKLAQLHAPKLTEYAFSVIAALQNQPIGRLTAGIVSFPKVSPRSEAAIIRGQHD